MRAAWIHALGDLLQNIGVMFAAILIWWQPFDVGTVITDDHPEGLSKWVYADPFCTFLFTLLVIYTTFGTVQDIVRSVLLSVPDGLDARKLRDSLESVEGVETIYDLHCFKVGQGSFLTAHCKIKVGKKGEAMAILKQLQVKVQKEFNFSHSTFQLETDDYDSNVNKLSLGNKLACQSWNSDDV